MLNQKEDTRRKLFLIITAASIAFLLAIICTQIFTQYSPVILAFADGEGKTTAGSGTVSKLVEWVAMTAGGIVAILLMISIAKDVFGLATGKGGNGGTSPIKIVGKVLFLILCIGLIFLAKNYTQLGNTASGVGNKVISTLNSEINNLP